MEVVETSNTREYSQAFPILAKIRHESGDTSGARRGKIRASDSLTQQIKLIQGVTAVSIDYRHHSKDEPLLVVTFVPGAIKPQEIKRVVPTLVVGWSRNLPRKF